MDKITAARNELDSRMNDVTTMVEEEHDSHDDEREYAKTWVAAEAARIAITRLTDEQLREVLGLALNTYHDNMDLYKLD